MRFIPSLIFLAQCVSFTLGKSEVQSGSCAEYVSTQYVTVSQTIYSSIPSNTMHPGSGSNGESVTSVVIETVTQVITQTIISESIASQTITQVITKTPAPQTITEVITETLAPQTVTQVVTETLAPQTITQVITESVTPTAKTIPILTPIYTNATMKNSPTTSSANIPIFSSGVSFSNSTTISLTNSTSTSMTNPTSIPVNNSTSTSLANATSTSMTNPTSISVNNSTSTSVANSTSTTLITPSACYDGCALNVISSPDYCSSIFQTTIYPSTVTQTVYTTAFPSNTTLSNIISTETLIETLLFTSSETSTTTTVYESTTALTTIVTDNTVTVTSTTGTTTVTATSTSGSTTPTIEPVKKRHVPRLLFTSSLSIPTITVSPDLVLSSACTDSAAYLSACSCAGVSHVITTLPTPTITITSIINERTLTFTNNLTTTTQTATSVSTSLTSDVGYTSTVDLTVTFETTATATTDVIASTTVAPIPTGNAYCEDGSTVDGLSSPCTGDTCITFNLRIEGATDTIYEGPIYTGPQDITTASGGTHLCNGENDGANPSPRGTGTTALSSAGGLCGFDFDGTYSSSFQDYFIERIGGTAQTGNEFWGILNNFAFTPTGGCQTEPATGDQLLWAFNAFNANYFLDIEPKVQTMDVGTVVVFTVTGHDGNGGGSVPISGASFNGVTTNSNGQVVFVATEPGTFRYKATRSDSIRSPAVIITVNSVGV